MAEVERQDPLDLLVQKVELVQLVILEALAQQVLVVRVGQQDLLDGLGLLVKQVQLVVQVGLVHKVQQVLVVPVEPQEEQVGLVLRAGLVQLEVQDGLVLLVLLVNLELRELQDGPDQTVQLELLDAQVLQGEQVGLDHRVPLVEVEQLEEQGLLVLLVKLGQLEEQVGLDHRVSQVHLVSLEELAEPEQLVPQDSLVPWVELVQPVQLAQLAEQEQQEARDPQAKQVRLVLPVLLVVLVLLEQVEQAETLVQEDHRVKVVPLVLLDPAVRLVLLVLV